MDIPIAPRDTGLRNIIDKLAEFVARNGPEFEAITKAKQKGNPKFEFLYGGEFYNYYQYRVASEQTFLKQQASISQAQHHNQQQPSGMQQLPGQHSQQQMGFPKQNLGIGQPNMNPQNMNQQGLSQQGITQQGINQQGLWSSSSSTNNTSNSLTSQIEAINMQQNTLRDQIRQSEQNLSAQHGVLLQQQQKQIDEAITKAQNDTLQKQADDNNIRLPEFDAILQPIIESCTKDSISTGKNWILQHTSDTAKCNVVLQYLLKKALVNGSTFSQKLHLIYLVNDVLHHCVRKNANDLKSCLENVVIPMFCSADIIANDEQKAKLSKLLSLWESKAKFFDACVISKLRSPESSMQEYKTNLMNVHNNIVTQFTQATKAALDSYQQQHKVFIQHATQQIALLENQKQSLEQQVLASVLPNPALIPPLIDPQQLQAQNMPSNSMMGSNSVNSPINNMSIPSKNIQMQPNIQMQNNGIQMPNNGTQIQSGQMMNSTQKPPPLMAQQISMPADASFSNPSITTSNNQQKSSQNLFSSVSNANNNSNSYHQQSLMGYPQSFSQNNVNSNSSDYTSPPPSFQIPDLSKPPPGFSSSVSQPPPKEEEVKPSAPYYELPAGLMVPLIRLEDYSYKPLDPDEIRIPPPAPQNERLSSAVVAFYSLPSHDRPRDVEGWEKLGLYEYYKVKNAARKQKEEEIQKGVRDKSRSPTPIILEPTKPKKPNKRCYKSKSRSRSKSPSRSPRRSRSRSPERSRSRYSSIQRSRSPKRSPIRDRERDRDRERERDRERDRDRGKDRERERERDRSVTPPSFFGGNYAKSSEFIEESNKGHQMLMKMGWAGSGTGLGSKNQGIDSPISGGEVRDRKDMYKGVGINLNDPYENFRKNKGAAFIHRMRSRAEEKS